MAAGLALGCARAYVPGWHLALGRKSDLKHVTIEPWVHSGAGRVGSAFAAELGTMQVSEQTDSLRVLGSDPVDYLVSPRVVACMIAGPILNVLCFTMGERAMRPMIHAPAGTCAMHDGFMQGLCLARVLRVFCPCSSTLTLVQQIAYEDVSRLDLGLSYRGGCIKVIRVNHGRPIN